MPSSKPFAGSYLLALPQLSLVGCVLTKYVHIVEVLLRNGLNLSYCCTSQPKVPKIVILFIGQKRVGVWNCATLLLCFVTNMTTHCFPRELCDMTVAKQAKSLVHWIHSTNACCTRRQALDSAKNGRLYPTSNFSAYFKTH